jgi:hypothetical protein
MTKEQAVRAKIIFDRLETKFASFHFNPWATLETIYQQQVPIDYGIEALRRLEAHASQSTTEGGKVKNPWAYLQGILAKDYPGIDLKVKLEEHERIKGEPATVGKILAEAQRRAEAKKPEDPTPWV